MLCQNIFKECLYWVHIFFCTVHCKKKLAVFPSPAGMSLIKLFLGGNNLVFSRPERVWSVTSRLETGKWLTLFYSVCSDEKVRTFLWFYDEKLIREESDWWEKKNQHRNKLTSMGEVFLMLAMSKYIQGMLLLRSYLFVLYVLMKK